MTPQNVQKINRNFIISPNIFIFLISCHPPPPPTKNVIQNFESPKMDRTYLYMIISVCHTPPPAKKLTNVLQQYAAKYSCLSAYFSVSQSISQSASLPNQPLQFLSVDRASLQKCILVTEEYLRVPGGLGGVGNSFFFIRRVWPSIYHSPPRNIRNFKDLKNI